MSQCVRRRAGDDGRAGSCARARTGRCRSRAPPGSARRALRQPSSNSRHRGRATARRQRPAAPMRQRLRARRASRRGTPPRRARLRRWAGSRGRGAVPGGCLPGVATAYSRSRPMWNDSHPGRRAGNAAAAPRNGARRYGRYRQRAPGGGRSSMGAAGGPRRSGGIRQYRITLACVQRSCARSAAHSSDSSSSRKSPLSSAVCTSTSFVSGSARRVCPRRPRSRYRVASGDSQTW